jgi:hypothetical protein
LDSRNKSELTNFRRLILNSATTTLSNASPTSLCNYKSLLKEHLNLVDSRLNGSSIMSPPASTVNTANQSAVSSLQSEASQEGHAASNSRGISESTDGMNNSNTHVLDAAPTPQNLSHVFSEDSVSGNESSQSKSYTTAWRQSKSIQQSILSCGNSNEDRSRALTIALKHKSLKDIVAQAGAIIPKEYVTAIHHQKQQTKMIAVAKSNGNLRRQTEDRKTFVINNLVSIVSSPGTKGQKHELNGFQSMMQL